ncbi:MAG: SCO family protein [Stenotrophobium sp.]
MKSKSIVAVIAFIAILTGLAVASVIRGTSPPLTLQSGSLLIPPRTMPNFAPMTAADGSAFTRGSLTGHWTLLYPGYSYCPDVCPTTLALLGALTKARAQAKTAVQVVFLSIDPARDTPRRLGDYVRAFNPHFIGITAQEPMLAEFTKIFGIAYSRVAGSDASHYTMDHSSTLVLIDPKARISAYFTPPFSLQVLESDLHTALSAGQTN